MQTSTISETCRSIAEVALQEIAGHGSVYRVFGLTLGLSRSHHTEYVRLSGAARAKGSSHATARDISQYPVTTNLPSAAFVVAGALVVVVVGEIMGSRRNRAAWIRGDGAAHEFSLCAGREWTRWWPCERSKRR